MFKYIIVTLMVFQLSISAQEQKPAEEDLHSSVICEANFDKCISKCDENEQEAKCSNQCEEAFNECITKGEQNN
ncbi:hypothetical protein [Sulfurospirillum arcachonense]|uniref:hypothetical protein n=1 Tax=Sulfurospirillum arcachonense TaxID=57666 RepID=UPI00046801D5|nr:hypothetical protein [Sulfurospirillum arcachonense]